MSVIENSKSRSRRVGVERAITSGSALMEWRKKKGISRRLFAEMADCSERTLATCEKAKKIPATVERPVTETIRLIRALNGLAGDDVELKVWLNQNNRAFGDRSPIEVMKNGEADLLWEMVHQIRQGAFE